jgi:hypothetical protein
MELLKINKYKIHLLKEEISFKNNTKLITFHTNGLSGKSV